MYVCVCIFYSTANDVTERNKLIMQVYQCKMSQVVWPAIKAAVWESINLSIISSFLTGISFSL